jgi:hypothetical protein
MAFKMNYVSATRGQKIVILINAVFRLIQIVIATAIITLYVREEGFWLNNGVPARIVSSFSSYAPLNPT